MEEEYILEESTKALIDALARGGIFPPQLAESVSLLEQITKLEGELKSLQGNFDLLNKELAKYKPAYFKVKEEKDNLASTKLSQENRISDLLKQVEGLQTEIETLKSNLLRAKGRIQSLEKESSTHKVSFESIYQAVKASMKGRTNLFSSPTVKQVEIRVFNEAKSQGQDGVYLYLRRVNADKWEILRYYP